MKKIYSLLLCALLCLVLLAALASCGRMSAVATLTKITAEMAQLDSYSAATRMSLTFYSKGERVHGVSEGTLIELGRNDKDNYYFYQSAQTTTKCEGLGIDTSFTMTEAYDEGKYYIHSTNGKHSNKVSGPMEVDEFLEYMAFSGSFELNLPNCQKIKHKENPDGTGTIECSGYSKKTMKAISNALGVGAGSLGAEISDVKVYVTYNNDYRAEKIEYIFSFDVPKDTKKYPTLRMSFEYSDFGAAEKDPTLYPEEYSYYGNLRVFTEIERLLSEKINDKSGSFEVYNEQTIRAGVQIISFTEKDSIRYGERFGKYHFNIKMNVNDVGFAMQYKNGKLKTKGPDVSESEEMTDGDAKAYIASIINNALIDKTNLQSIVKVEENVYCITYNIIDSSAYSQMFAPYGGHCGTATHTVTVTLNNGELKMIESVININGSGASYMNVKTINKFD